MEGAVSNKVGQASLPAAAHTARWGGIGEHERKIACAMEPERLWGLLDGTERCAYTTRACLMRSRMSGIQHHRRPPQHTSVR